MNKKKALISLSKVGICIPCKFALFSGREIPCEQLISPTPIKSNLWDQPFIPGRKNARRWNGQYALGPMCGAEKDWHEHFFRASGELKGGLLKIFSRFFLYFKPPVSYF